LVEAFHLTGEQGQRIRLTMTSANLDPYLVLIDPNGEVVAEDDDAGGGFNAQIEVTLSMSGSFRVLATSLRYAEGGYELSVETVDPTADSTYFHAP
jgi:serine protease Do